ncbi:MAG: phosphate transport system regulatory protein PhoU, partial [Proteobacteria bacterium]
LLRRPINNLDDISKMSEMVRAMVKESLNCFVRGDTELAKRVLAMDDEVDRMKNKVFKDQMNVMKVSSEDVEACLDIILVARNLERLGDHATNIGEDVIFAFTGKDVRHGGKFAGP